MPISVPIPAKDVTVDQLVEIFNRFCKAYDFIPNEMDDIYIRYRGHPILVKGGTIDYRPFMGAKFFATGDDKHTEFWGYTSERPQKRKEYEFERLVMQYIAQQSG
jgi:hypothetical protein